MPASGVIASSAFNAGVKDALAFLLSTNVGCRLRRVANQSIANTTATNINWDTEDYDPYGFVAVTAATLTVPSGADGTYSLCYVGVVASLAAGGRNFASFNLGGTLPTGVSAAGPTRTTFTGDEDRFVLTATIPLVGGSTIICDIFITDAGAPRNFTGWLNVVRTGP